MRILPELLLEHTPFKDNYTGVRVFDNMLNNPGLARHFEEKGLEWELVHIPPAEYIKLLTRAHDTTPETERAMRSRETIKKYSRLMKDGKTEFPTLFLDFSEKFNKSTKYIPQDGAHRAFAAMDAGIDKVPVLIIYSTIPPKDKT